MNPQVVRLLLWKVLFIGLLGFLSSPSNGQTMTISLADAAAHAVELSQLTLLSSPSFHLKATVVEATNPDSGYRAEIEEYWVSPEKWRRIISSPKFSQVLIQTGNQQFEQSTGDYYPLWLRKLVTAVFEPVPMLAQLSRTSAHLQEENQQLERCAHFQMKVGGQAAQNSVNHVFCFDSQTGLLKGIVTPSYSAFFEDYQPFHGKVVARKITDDPEPGTTLVVGVTELSALADVDEKLFAKDQLAPTQPIRTLQIDQLVADTLALNTPAIQWPKVRSGKTSGVLSIYISADKSGRVREAWPLNSDNAGLDDSVRDQVKNWQFKTVAVEGVPVQLETVLTFAFDTKVANPVPLLTNEEARALATKIVEAQCLPEGASVTISVGVDEKGKIIGIGNPNNLDSQLFMPAFAALNQWQFRPYVKDGKVDRFTADITFVGK
ncbi:MAG: hypothetical protein ABSE85_16180 [Candidatus Korobacteraceae bacterium]